MTSDKIMQSFCNMIAIIAGRQMGSMNDKREDHHKVEAKYH